MYCLRHGTITNGDQSERQDSCSALERALRRRRLTTTIETFFWQKTTFKETNENSAAEEKRLKGEADALKAKPFFFKPGVKFTFLAIFALIDQGSFYKISLLSAYI